MLFTAENVKQRLSQRVPHRLPVTDVANLAAVAAVLRFDEQPEVLLIRRSEKPDDPWSGHMAFPGGRSEPADADPLATAIRETGEEVGIDLNRHGQLLGRLDDLSAIAAGRLIDLVIVPYVFALPPGIEPVAAENNDEVDEVLWAQLEPLRLGNADTTRPYVLSGEHLELPAFEVSGHVVWGLTYRMLSAFFEIMSA